MLDGKTILVTGGAGAIGSNLSRTLSRDNKVIIIDNLSFGYEENLEFGNSGNVTLIKGDIRNDDVLAEAFKHKPDVIFHLAASFANQKSIEDPFNDLEVNSTGTLKLLDLARKNDIGKFVYTSSSCVYGGRREQLREDMIPDPETPYAISKLNGEYYTNFFHKYYGMNTTTIRYFNVYGPNEHPGKYRNVIPNFFSLAMQGKTLNITGTGNETRDFTFVQDAVDATILCAVKEGVNGSILNIGRGIETTILELAKNINMITNNPGGHEIVCKRDWDSISRRWADVTRMKTLLEFEAKTPLDEGLRKTHEWFKTIKTY